MEKNTGKVREMCQSENVGNMYNPYIEVNGKHTIV